MSDTFPRPTHARIMDDDEGDGDTSEWLRLTDENNEHILNLCISGDCAGELWVNSARFRLAPSELMFDTDGNNMRIRIKPKDD